MIIGTAGHIDHGKSALVQALTQVNPDRLKEEQRRGITIDLGYAYKPLANGAILGFVDVPGHERFIHNMLAGATGIDYVMMAIAADDGPMPQTLEHLAIVDKLGLTQGVVALTKCDLVDAARIAQVTQQILTLLANTGLAHAPVMPVSVVSGAGVAELDAHLANIATENPQHSQNGHFRLAVDRCFTLSGIGTVVTGTVFSGHVKIGDRLLISPSGTEVRVRSIHAQNQVAESGHAGQRCALNLTAPGLEKKDINRGDWIIAPAIHAPTHRLDARLTLLAGETKPLVHWSPVHLHLGASDVLARVATLESEAIAPGQQQWVQLVLDTPIAALAGDRFIIRDPSATRTLGGGSIIDAFAAERGRRKPKRLEVLQALAQPDRRQSLKRLLDLNVDGVDLDWFTRLFNLDARDAEALFAQSELLAVMVDKRNIGFSQTRWQALQHRALAALNEHHLKQPDSPGLTLDALRNSIDKSMAKSVMALLVEHLLAQKQIVRVGARLATPNHEVKLSTAEQSSWQQLYVILLDSPLMPPTVPNILLRMPTNEMQLTGLLNRLAAMGKIYKVRNQQYFLAETIADLGSQVEQLALAKAPQRFTMAQFREATKVARGVAIPLLELYDRVGLTVRYKNGRRLRRDWNSVFGAVHNVEMEI